MKTFIFSLLALTVTLGVPASGASAPRSGRAPQNGPLIIDSALTILLSSHEPTAVKAATCDLASDFGKVMGKKPRIINRAQDTAAAAILIGEQSNLPRNMRPAGLTDPESFEISVTSASWKPGPPTRVVLLAGADMRGTIYAIYEFAEKYLGIDPLYYWADHQPLKRSQIKLSPTLNTRFPPPVFKHRGFFINDEDLLTGWAPGEKDGTGISLQVWNKIFETILRLKGDMVAPGTWIFPYEPQVKLAAERGLIVTQHHAIPLGLNVARWPKDVPYNYTTHPEILDRAWKDAVQEYPAGAEVLWTVGLRGLSDISYASMDPSVRANDKALGRLIGKAIVNQMQIVRSVHPDAQFITSLWMEGARLVRQGDLNIPGEVTAVWGDDGYGYLQDEGQVARGEGAYYHVAVMNGRANQLSEMVPVKRIFSELGRYIRAGATQYLLLNTSDIRPVTMTAKAVMDVAWKGVPPGGPGAADRYLRAWARTEFGASAAPKVTEVYKEYFLAPAQFGVPPREYGDQLYHSEARRMMLTYMISPPLYALPSQSPPWVEPHIFGFGAYENVTDNRWLSDVVQREIRLCGDTQARWDAAWKEALEAESLVPADRLPFYRAHVLAMVVINRESNRMLLQIAQAIHLAQAGQSSEARQAAGQALLALDEINKVEMAAEYGKWRNWYRGDWLTGVYRTRQMVGIFSQFLGNPLAHLPSPVFWDGWEAYYHIMHYEGNRSADVK